MATRTEQYIAELNDVKEKIAENRQQIVELEQVKAQAIADVAKFNGLRDNCAKMPSVTGKQKQAKSDCTTQNENARLNAQARTNSANNSIASLTAEINSLESAKKILESSLQSAQQSDDQAKIVLANQGQTFEGIQAREQGNAMAQLQVATINAEAEASNKKKAKNVNLIITVAVAGVVITAGTILLIRKLKKKKA